MDHRNGRLIQAVCGFTLALLLAPAAMATEGERDECPTWFPDLRCEREIRFDGFVPPMGMPYLFEEPFVTTGIQFVGIWHDFPDVGAYRGGQAGIMALQLRLAITEDLAFIPTKDGLVIYRPDTTFASVGAIGPGSDNLLVDDETGFADVTIGFKYALLKLPEHNFILTPALRYEIPIGQHQVLQRFGDGVIIPSASFAWGIDDLKVIGSLGASYERALHGKENSFKQRVTFSVSWDI